MSPTKDNDFKQANDKLELFLKVCTDFKTEKKKKSNGLESIRNK